MRANPPLEDTWRARRRPVVEIGYVPMTDCAPIVAAAELGLFERHGIDVVLRREPGWATVREKVAHGELHAAQAPASMVFELSCGWGTIRSSCLTGFVTAHNGNAITLSNELRELGVSDAVSLGELVREWKGRRRFRFAGVLRFSSQYYLMRRWLQSGGIDPDEDVEMVIVPPPQVHACLKAGHLDGYCVAEPWSSIGLLQGVGWCATLTSDFDPMHVEKVFMVRQDFHDGREDCHLAILSALRQSAEWCDESGNRRELAEMLARPEYLDLPEEAIATALVGPFEMGYGRRTNASRAIVFHDQEANRPTLEKARWALREIEHHGLVPPAAARLSDERIARHYRTDVYDSIPVVGPRCQPQNS